MYQRSVNSRKCSILVLDKSPIWTTGLELTFHSQHTYFINIFSYPMVCLLYLNRESSNLKISKRHRFSWCLWHVSVSFVRLKLKWKPRRKKKVRRKERRARNPEKSLAKRKERNPERRGRRARKATTKRFSHVVMWSVSWLCGH